MSHRSRPAPRLLRVGLIRDGKLSAERTLLSGQSLRYEELGVARLTLHFGQEPVLRATGSGWVLCFPSDAEGRVQQEGRSSSLHELPTCHGGLGLLELTLAQNQRGKVMMGDVSLLFQELPSFVDLGSLSFRPRFFDTNDRTFLGCLSVSATFGALFGAWALAQPPVAHAEVVDFSSLPTPVVSLMRETPKDPVEDLEKLSASEVHKPLKVKARPDARELPSSAPSAERPRPVEQVSALLAILGSKGPSESPLRVVDRLGSAELEEELDELMKRRSGAEVAQSDGVTLKDGAAREVADIGELGLVPTEGEVGLTEAPDTRVGEVNPEAEGTHFEGGDSSDMGRVSEVVRKNRDSIRYCYETALKLNPSASGRVELFFVVSGGKAQEVSVLRSDIQDPDMESCLQRAVGRWSFPEDLEGEAEYPFVLTPR